MDQHQSERTAKAFTDLCNLRKSDVANVPGAPDDLAA